MSAVCYADQKSLSAVAEAPLMRFDAIGERMTASRRLHERYQGLGSLDVFCEIWGRPVSLHGKDVSRGGLFIESKCPPPIHSELEISVRLPNGSEALLTGQVIHIVSAERAQVSKERCGFGVRFSELNAEQQTWLEQLLESISNGGSTTQTVVAPNNPPASTNAQSSPTQAASSKTNDKEAGLLQELQKELAQRKERDFFGVLDIDATDDITVLRAAYFELSRKYHPDLYSLCDNPEIKTTALKLFLRINQAYKKLNDSSLLPAYLDKISASLTRGTAVSNRQDERNARQPSPKVRDRNKGPSRATVPTLHERTREPSISEHVSKARRDIAHKCYDDALESLGAALALDADNQDAQLLHHVVQARQLRMQGKAKESLSKYESVLQLEPRHVEALMAIRADKRSKGIFSRLRGIAER